MDKPSNTRPETSESERPATAPSRRRSGIFVYALPAIVFAILGLFLFRGLYLNPRKTESPMIGQPVPSFELPALSDPAAAISTADLSDPYYLVNFWATWCEGCLVEHDFLLQLARQGMPIYGINWKDERELALNWIASRGDPFVMSATDYEGNVAIDFGVYGAPETFLVGPDRTILNKVEGPLSPRVWEAEFAPFISAAGIAGDGTD